MAIWNRTDAATVTFEQAVGAVRDGPHWAKERPGAPKIQSRIDRELMPEDALAEYRAVAQEVGVEYAALVVEEFRHFLAKRDIPTFNYQEVVRYMDEVAARDNPTKLGWHWCPVRAKDADTPMTFGRPSEIRRASIGANGRVIEEHFVASDYYESHRHRPRGNGDWTPEDWRQARSRAYARTIPLHALKKIALIEREFNVGGVVFLVSDYTIAPHVIVDPDPFLMAVIPNNAVAHGKGRFIIDVWDEPGFGIERMIR